MRPFRSFTKANGLTSVVWSTRGISHLASPSKGAINGLINQTNARPRQRQRTRQSSLPSSHRQVVTLAIETSCDDTCVAVLEKHDATSPDGTGGGATLHFNGRITSDNREHGGIHPSVAKNGHGTSLGPLVQQAIAHLPSGHKPDFVTVTRGPGMRGSLAVGLDTAKGLALAWDVPLLAVNHMQSHALTPQLVTALSARSTHTPYTAPSPSYPFLTLLVSGGHTMLVLSTSPTTHTVLAPLQGGLAIGDLLDKTARILLPPDILAAHPDTSYAAALEPFAFPYRQQTTYIPPPTRGEEIAPFRVLNPDTGKHILTMTPCLPDTRHLSFEFNGLGSQVQKYITDRDREVSLSSRRALAAAAMRLAFEHLAGRVVLVLSGAGGPALRDAIAGVKTLVVSGGVARNGFLRRVLREVLSVRGFGEDRIEIVAPDPELCTDNAAMIGWTGIGMWEEGWESEMGVLPVRKWEVDPKAEDGGILGVDGWRRRDGEDVRVYKERMGGVMEREAERESASEEEVGSEEGGQFDREFEELMRSSDIGEAMGDAETETRKVMKDMVAAEVDEEQAGRRTPGLRRVRSTGGGARRPSQRGGHEPLRDHI